MVWCSVIIISRSWIQSNIRNFEQWQASVARAGLSSCGADPSFRHSKVLNSNYFQNDDDYDKDTDKKLLLKIFWLSYIHTCNIAYDHREYHTYTFAILSYIHCYLTTTANNCYPNLARRRSSAEEIDTTMKDLDKDRMAMLQATEKAEKVAQLVFASASAICITNSYSKW